MKSYTADTLFDGKNFMLEGSSIQVDNSGRIISFNQPENCQSIHCEGLLMPGMINAHCHLELSHLKNKFAQHTGLISFLKSVMSTRHEVEESHRILAIVDAEQRMLERGIVAVGDICNGLSTAETKAKARMHYHSFVECVGLNEDRVPEIMQHAFTLQSTFQKTHAASLVLHAPYSVSKLLMESINKESSNSIHSIHNQESAEENRLFQEARGEFVPFIEGITGKPYSAKLRGSSSLQAYFPLLSNPQQHLLVHNTFCAEEDIDFLHAHKQNIFFCLCPNANMFIENRLPPVTLFLQKDCRIVIGTDSLASNYDLCLFSEIEVLRTNFPEVDLSVWLHAACLQGAKALNMENHLGSFEPGKKPGVVQWINWNKKEKAKVAVLEKA